MTENTLLSLNKIKKGMRAVIIKSPTGKEKSQLIRLGIIKGEIIKCIEKLPGGTIVIKKNRREISLGSDLARNIFVNLITK